jgi:signal peptidase
MNTTIKRVFDVVSWVALAVLVLLTLVLILSAFNIGVRAFVVSSGSMSPAIHTGDLVIVRKSGGYEKGDVITFIDSRNKYISHRIYKVEEKDGKTTYTTKGDANNTPDGSPVSEVNVMGRVVFHIPLMGIPIAFFHTKIGLALLILSIGAILIWLILSSDKSPKKETNS